MDRHLAVSRLGGLLLALLLVSVSVGQQLNPDQAALMMLDSGRRAFNEGKYPFAAERFREFLKQHGGHAQAAAAHYGLGLALLESPEKDYRSAAESLRRAGERRDWPDWPLALYYAGAALRALGEQVLEQAAAKPPQEAGNLRSTANSHFEEAGKQFAAAAAGFAERIKAAATAPPSESADPPWLARARCDQGEMLLRLKKFKEAGELAQKILAETPEGLERQRQLALYQSGYARFAMKDYLAAGRALSQLAPFRQEFGGHARYLLSRTHHLADERPEAAAGYKAVLADHDEQKKSARETLRRSGLRPAEKARLEALANGPLPEYVLRSSFYSGLLAAEDGRYGEALERFSTLLQQHPKFSLADEAQLRRGYCLVQLKSHAEAIKTLEPLRDHAQLSDQALRWLARAQQGAADPANTQAYGQALRTAIDTLSRAAEQANRLASSDPEAKIRRGEILLDLADTQQLAGQYQEAANTYQKVLQENNNPDRAEEAVQRQATALHLAGRWRESDDLCQRFEKTYPKSTLLGAVLFRFAENAYFAAAAEAKQNRPQEVQRLLGEAIARYQRLLKLYPEFPYANLARFNLATAHCQLKQYAEAVEVLSAIAEMERTGELAPVGYLMADCHIRLLPPEAEDAIQAARLVENAGKAARLLEGFLAANAKAPQAPDALLKLGYCYQRIGGVLADPAEQKKTLTAAKDAYDRLLQQFGRENSASLLATVSTAHFERGKCLVLLGDPSAAASQLRRFEGEPLRNSPVAPLAMVRYAWLLRAQNRPAEAVKTLEQFRGQKEAELQKDPERAEWAAMLHYEHALALKETGKLAEARTMFEDMAKRYAGRPQAANALWRAGQCRREKLMADLAAAQETLAKRGIKPEEITAAGKAIEAGFSDVRSAADSFKDQASALAKTAAGSEAHLRVLYELAWCHRILAEAEIETARQKIQREMLEKIGPKLSKHNPPGVPPPELRVPEIPLVAIAAQPSEKAAVEHYQRLIAAAPQSALAVQARLELAELRLHRAAAAEAANAAIDLLSDALETNPPAAAAEQIRLRLAACLLVKHDPQAALGQLQLVSRKPDSPVTAEARYLAGEAYIQQKAWEKAIEQLQPIRDHGPLQNVPGVSDRALFRLGQACTQVERWDDARRALESLVQRFPKSPWVEQAYYAIGWTWESQKQWDNAVNAYNEVTRRALSEVAARAQLHVGLCRLEQKRFPEAANALLVVAYAYDYPQWNPPAFCEAGRAYSEMKQPQEAVKLYERVIKEHANSPWAKTAEQRLKELQSNGTK